MMKKLFALLLSALLTFGICMGLVGCSDDLMGIQSTPDEYRIVWSDCFDKKYEMNFSQEKGKDSYQIVCDVEYPACVDKSLSFTLEGLYHKNGKAVGTELYQTISDFGGVMLDAVGHRLLKIPCEFYYLKDGTKYVDYTIDFRFSVTVTENKLYDKYVTMEDAEVPFDYFACDMQMVDANTYDLSQFKDMLGANNSADDYECGVVYTSFYSNNLVNYVDRAIAKRQNKDGIVGLVLKESQRDGQYNRYVQLKGTDPYLLEETDGYELSVSNGLFSVRKFTGTGELGLEELLPYRVKTELFENDENIVYRAAEKDGYLYLSISGQVSEGSGVYRNNITATYKIKGTKIVAWLCESTYASEFAISYTRTIYGIPLEGDISLIDEETLDSLCLE